MNWKHLFFSFEGRLGRKSFWVGLVMLVAVILVLGGAALLLTRGDDPRIALLLILAIQLALLHPLLAVLVKRLHTRARAGWLSGLALAPFLLAALLGGLGVLDPAAPGALEWLFLLRALAAGLWVVVDLGLMHSVPLPPPPVTPARPAAAARRGPKG